MTMGIHILCEKGFWRQQAYNVLYFMFYFTLFYCYWIFLLPQKLFYSTERQYNNNEFLWAKKYKIVKQKLTGWPYWRQECEVWRNNCEKFIFGAIDFFNTFTRISRSQQFDSQKCDIPKTDKRKPVLKKPTRSQYRKPRSKTRHTKSGTQHYLDIVANHSCHNNIMLEWLVTWLKLTLHK